MSQLAIGQFRALKGSVTGAGLLVSARHVLAPASVLADPTPGATTQITFAALPGSPSANAQVVFHSPDQAAHFAVLELSSPIKGAKPLAGLTAPSHPPQQYQPVQVEGAGQLLSGRLGAGDAAGRFELALEDAPPAGLPLAGLPIRQAASGDLLGIVVEDGEQLWLLPVEIMIQKYPILDAGVQEALALLEARNARQEIERLYTISQQADSAQHVLQVGVVMGDLVQSGVDAEALLAELRALITGLQVQPPRRSPWLPLGVLAGVILVALVIAAVITRPGLAFEPARTGEALIIVAPFEGAITDLETFPERYVLDVLSEHVAALNRSSGAVTYRLERNPAPLNSQRAARELGLQYGATLVIWGQMDDIGGVRSFVEIMPLSRLTSGRAAGNWMGAELLPWGQRAVSADLRSCLLEGTPAQADYLVSLSLGLLALDQMGWDEALGHFATAIETGETAQAAACGFNLEHGYYWRGYTLTLLERLPAALADLDQALVLAPDFLPALAQRGTVRLSMGLVSAAAADFSAALELAAGESPANQALLQRNLALALLQDQQLDAARAALEAASALDGENADPSIIALNQFINGAILRQTAVNTLQRDPGSGAVLLDEAQAAYDQSRALYMTTGDQNGQANVLLHVGTLHLHRDDPATALAVFTAALEVFESTGTQIGQANAYAGQALAYNALGLPAEARTAADLVERIMQRLNSGPVTPP